MKNSFLVILTCLVLFSCSQAIQKDVEDRFAEDKDIQSSALGGDRTPPKSLYYLRPEDIRWRWGGGRSGTEEKTNDNKMPPDQKEPLEAKQTSANTLEQKIDEKESPATHIVAAGSPESPGPSDNGTRNDADGKKEVLQKEEEHVTVEKPVAEAEKPDHDKYYVQIGAWKNPGLAETMLKNIKNLYPKAYIIIEHNLHKVRVPGGKTKEEGLRTSKDIEKKFTIKTFVALNP